MGALWFWIVGVMLTLYVIFDGFDIGVGILHTTLARNDSERRLSLRSIGPVWDGNEVWLLAGGGTLYFAFPLLYASAFSGFYLPLMIVLWLLILRGCSVELRNHIRLRVWLAFFDGLFTLSSALLAIFFGAALANVIRGVPIGPDGFFFLPLWTNWRIGPHPGILDWYTVIGGLVAFVSLAMHGALYLAVKTTDDLYNRARQAVRILWIPLLALTLVSLIATIMVRPQTLNNYTRFPIAFLIPIGVVASLAGMLLFSRKGDDKRAFFASCTYLGLMLVGAAAALYPVLLPSVSGPGTDITVANALTGQHALHVGIIWWSFGTLLAVLYFVITYRLFRGKVTLHA